MGADIVVGEAQPFGIPLWYGGPYLGFFTTKKSYVHKMAGRLIGETVDNRGQRSYVLTLTAREQHIKRERATSNICSNQGLLALASAVYMSTLGKTGLQQVANLCYQKAHYAASELGKIKGFKINFDEPFFHEFVLRCPQPASEVEHEPGERDHDHGRQQVRRLLERERLGRTDAGLQVGRHDQEHGERDRVGKERRGQPDHVTRRFGSWPARRVSLDHSEPPPVSGGPAAPTVRRGPGGQGVDRASTARQGPPPEDDPR
jgi:hypothetical protein